MEFSWYCKASKICILIKHAFINQHYINFDVPVVIVGEWINIVVVLCSFVTYIFFSFPQFLRNHSWRKLLASIQTPVLRSSWIWPTSWWSGSSDRTWSCLRIRRSTRRSKSKAKSYCQDLQQRLSRILEQAKSFSGSLIIFKNPSFTLNLNYKNRLFYVIKVMSRSISCVHVASVISSSDCWTKSKTCKAPNSKKFLSIVTEA